MYNHGVKPSGPHDTIYIRATGALSFGSKHLKKMMNESEYDPIPLHEIITEFGDNSKIRSSRIRDNYNKISKVLRDKGYKGLLKTWS